MWYIKVVRFVKFLYCTSLSKYLCFLFTKVYRECMLWSHCWDFFKRSLFGLTASWKSLLLKQMSGFQTFDSQFITSRVCNDQECWSTSTFLKKNTFKLVWCLTQRALHFTKIYHRGKSTRKKKQKKHCLCFASSIFNARPIIWQPACAKYISQYKHFLCLKFEHGLCANKPERVSLFSVAINCEITVSLDPHVDAILKQNG